MVWYGTVRYDTIKSRWAYGIVYSYLSSITYVYDNYHTITNKKLVYDLYTYYRVNYADKVYVRSAMRSYQREKLAGTEAMCELFLSIREYETQNWTQLNGLSALRCFAKPHIRTMDNALLQNVILYPAANTLKNYSIR